MTTNGAAISRAWSACWSLLVAALRSYKANTVDFPPFPPYAKKGSFRGNVLVFHLRALLMVLIGLRLLMPPGICACKWSSPAARLLLALVCSDRQLPVEQSRHSDDDHDAGCPASPLSAGMGVAPPCQPLLPPGLAFDSPPSVQMMFLFCSLPTEQVVSLYLATSSSALYLTVCALLL
jgi:hypothetical protein